MVNTEVVIVKKGKKIDKENKKKYEYRTKESQLERELTYKENVQEVLKNIRY